MSAENSASIGSRGHRDRTFSRSGHLLAGCLWNRGLPPHIHSRGRDRTTTPGVCRTGAWSTLTMWTEEEPPCRVCAELSAPFAGHSSTDDAPNDASDNVSFSQNVVHTTCFQVDEHRRGKPLPVPFFCLKNSCLCSTAYPVLAITWIQKKSASASNGFASRDHERWRIQPRRRLKQTVLQRHP